MMDIHKATTKSICKCFVKMKYEVPTAISKWETDFEISDDWKCIFRLPYNSTRETQLQALQFRILHRFLPCKKWLYDISIMNSNLCLECNVIDTIEHYIYACKPVKHFW
jgi:hypothetical protein